MMMPTPGRRRAILPLVFTVVFFMLSVPRSSSEEPDGLSWLKTIDFDQAPRREFYVDGDHAKASDQNPGTPQLPWKTIQRGVRDLEPGDALWIKRGTYRESIALTRSGTPEARVLISAAPGEEVVVSGAVPVSGWQRYETIQVPRPKITASTRINPLDWRGEPPGAKPGENTRPPAVFKHYDGKVEPTPEPYRGLCSRLQVTFDGQRLPQVFSKQDLQQGTWFFDPQKHNVHLWPLGGKSARRSTVELVEVEPSGAAEHVVIWKAAYPGAIVPPENVTWSGADNWNNWVERGQTFLEMVFANDKKLIRMFELKDLQPGTYYLDTAAKEIYCCLPQGEEMSNTVVEAGDKSWLLRSAPGANLHDITLRGIHFRYAINSMKGGQNRIETPAVTVNDAQRILVDKVRVSWCRSAGLMLRMNRNSVIRNTRIDHMGVSGAAASSSRDFLVEGCEFDHNCWAYYPGFATGGNKFAVTRNFVVRRCVGHHNAGPGIWFDVANHDSKILECVCYENDAGIDYEISGGGGGAEIADCLVFGNRVGMVTRNSMNMRIHHNLICNNTQLGIEIPCGGSQPPKSLRETYFPKNNLVAQNLFVGNRFASLALYDQPSQNIYSSKLAANNRTARNLFAPLPGEEGVQVIWGLDQRIGRGPNRNRANGAAESFRDLSLFRQSFPGVDDGSQVGDVKLADPDHLDFRVRNVAAVKDLDAGPRKPIRVGGIEFGRE